MPDLRGLKARSVKKGLSMEKFRKTLYIAITVAVIVAVACGVYVFGVSKAMVGGSNSSASAASKEETAGSSASAGSASAASSSNASSQAASDSQQQADPSSDSAHTHMWRTEEKTVDVPAVTHTETVTTPGEDIVEYHTVCDDCGAYLDSQAALESHYRNYPSHAAHGYTTGVPVVTGQRPGKTETKTVVDSPATTKTVTVRTCTICGAVEEEG